MSYNLPFFDQSSFGSKEIMALTGSSRTKFIAYDCLKCRDRFKVEQRFFLN